MSWGGVGSALGKAALYVRAGAAAFHAGAETARSVFATSQTGSAPPPCAEDVEFREENVSGDDDVVAVSVFDRSTQGITPTTTTPPSSASPPNPAGRRVSFAPTPAAAAAAATALASAVPKARAPEVAAAAAAKSKIQLLLFPIDDGVLRDPATGQTYYHVLFDKCYATSIKSRYNERGEKDPAGRYGIITSDLVCRGIPTTVHQ